MLLAAAIVAVALNQRPAVVAVAPVLGELIADAVLGRTNRFSHKFRWRTDPAAAWLGDAARSS